MLEPIENQYMEVGYVARSHGISGEVLIQAGVFAPQLFDDIALVYIQNARGDLIPARIESVRVQQKQNRLTFFVKLEHVTDRNQAEELKGCTVYVQRSQVRDLIEEDEHITNDYTSFNVYDENNRYIGVVSQVIDTPAHLILEVVTEDQGQLLIPFVDEYVRSSDTEARVIQCQNLNQLTDEL
jgi:16S rRNA processing protein RimM